MKFRFAIALLPASFIHSVLALNLYASPTGSDDQPGTTTAPVKTLEVARKIAGRHADKEPVTITNPIAPGDQQRYFRLRTP